MESPMKQNASSVLVCTISFVSSLCISSNHTVFIIYLGWPWPLTLKRQKISLVTPHWNCTILLYIVCCTPCYKINVVFLFSQVWWASLSSFIPIFMNLIMHLYQLIILYEFNVCSGISLGTMEICLWDKEPLN